MKNILPIVYIFILILSCNSIADPNKNNKPNPDPSLKGQWIGSTHGEYLTSISEFKYYNYYSYTFGDDNLIWYYSTRSKYGVKLMKYTFTYEYKIENNKYYKKLYDNEYDTWEEFTIEKISDTVIKINEIELTKR